MRWLFATIGIFSIQSSNAQYSSQSGWSYHYHCISWSISWETLLSYNWTMYSCNTMVGETHGWMTGGMTISGIVYYGLISVTTSSTGGTTWVNNNNTTWASNSWANTTWRTDTLTNEQIVARLFEKWLTRFANFVDFMPTQEITREQAAKFFVVIATKVLNLRPDLTKNCSFTDSRDFDITLTGHICDAVRLGIIKWMTIKWNLYFAPRSRITYGQVVTILIRMIDKAYDETTTPRYKNYYLKAIELGLLANMSASQITMWDRNATRIDLGRILYRAAIRKANH